MQMTDRSVSYHVEVILPLVQTAEEHLLPLVSDGLKTLFQ